MEFLRNEQGSWKRNLIGQVYFPRKQIYVKFEE